MAGLKAFRIIPTSLVEWGRWFTDQDLQTNDDSVFTGVVTGSNLLRGEGSPEGVTSGSPGDLYTNTRGGTDTTMYVKETGTATKTGWIAK